jgi:pilus assembly protein CpaE
MTDARPIRVVVVDDDPETMALVCIKLRDNARIQIVGTGHSGREAIQLANTLRPDCMVLDVMMPILNGLEAAARISSVFPSIGLVMLTSDASPESIRAALRAGAKDYLDKSTELYRLCDAVVAADEKRDRVAVDKGLASVWAFYSAKGAAGSTTLAVATAHELSRAGHRVLLMDLDFLHGDCGFYLNLSPGQLNLYTQLAQMSSIDMNVLSPFIKRYRVPGAEAGGFDVLESPSDFVQLDSRAEENLVGIMDLLITSNDFVLLDLPAGRIFDAQNIAMLDFVERLFFITNRDMASLRSLLVFSRVIARSTIKIARFTVLFSALREQSTFDYQEWLASTRLATKSFMEVPFDAKTTSKAISGGLPVQVADPESPLARFAQRLMDLGLRRDPADEGDVLLPARKAGIWQAFKRMLGG